MRNNPPFLAPETKHRPKQLEQRAGLRPPDLAPAHVEHGAHTLYARVCRYVSAHVCVCNMCVHTLHPCTCILICMCDYAHRHTPTHAHVDKTHLCTMCRRTYTGMRPRTCTYACTCTCVHVCAHKHIQCVHMHTCGHTHIHVRTHRQAHRLVIHMHMHEHAHVHTCMHRQRGVQVHMQICTCMHTHTPDTQIHSYVHTHTPCTHIHNYTHTHTPHTQIHNYARTHRSIFKLQIKAGKYIPSTWTVACACPRPLLCPTPPHRPPLSPRLRECPPASVLASEHPL